jgi:hypothetical protein
MAYNNPQTLLGRASDSSGTSPAIFIGDARVLSISRITSSASASNLTVSLSNDDGFQSAIVNWSLATLLPSRGIFTIDPGARWLQVERANFQMGSVSSNETVLLSRYYE